MDDIQETATFECVVRDRRAGTDSPKTTVRVTVHVADGLLDVCDGQYYSGAYWPQTLKVKKNGALLLSLNFQSCRSFAGLRKISLGKPLWVIYQY